MAAAAAGRDAGERPHEVECVYIPDTDRGTLCVSSQVGCTLTCSFCHTGTQRLVRNLTAGEIVGQVMVARDRLGDWPGGTRPTDGVVPTGDRCITNIVMMGMGEPLYNFEAVRDALLIVADGEGIAISKRRITLSTSGVVPNIERAGAEIGCMLAVSLHAVRDELRNELVPLNRKYPIAQLLEACRNYPGLSNARRITFEYVMLKGVNDSIEDAKALVRLLKGIPAKINLIPFNPWPGSSYECSDWEQIEKFSEVVFDAGYASPVRTPRGRDILAACGQLKSATEKLSARERMALRAMAMTDDTGRDWRLMHSSAASSSSLRRLLAGDRSRRRHRHRHRRCSGRIGTARPAIPVERTRLLGARRSSAPASPARSGCLPLVILIGWPRAFKIRSLLVHAVAGAASCCSAITAAGLPAVTRNRSTIRRRRFRARPKSPPRSALCSASPIG